jgi:hypothetical protein
MVVRSTFERIDVTRKKGSLDLFFDVYKDGKLLERYHECGEYALLSKEKITKLLEENGFGVQSIYGDLDKSKYRSNSARIILVTRKNSRSFASQ